MWVTMLFTTVLSSLMASVALGASLTKVNYPNNATSKVDMYVSEPEGEALVLKHVPSLTI